MRSGVEGIRSVWAGLAIGFMWKAMAQGRVRVRFRMRVAMLVEVKEGLMRLFRFMRRVRFVVATCAGALVKVRATSKDRPRARQGAHSGAEVVRVRLRCWLTVLAKDFGAGKGGMRCARDGAGRGARRWTGGRSIGTKSGAGSRAGFGTGFISLIHIDIGMVLAICGLVVGINDSTMW